MTGFLARRLIYSWQQINLFSSKINKHLMKIVVYRRMWLIAILLHYRQSILLYGIIHSVLHVRIIKIVVFRRMSGIA